MLTLDWQEHFRLAADWNESLVIPPQETVAGAPAVPQIFWGHATDGARTMSGGFPDPAVATAKATAALAELDLNKLDHIILARIHNKHCSTCLSYRRNVKRYHKWVFFGNLILSKVKTLIVCRPLIEIG